MKFDIDFWNETWRKESLRYNKHHQKIWEKIIPYLKGKIVDLGCGNCSMYIGQKVDLTGVDSSVEALKASAVNYPSGKFILADIKNSGLPSGEFDTIILSGVLNYYQDLEDVLSEAKRIGKYDAKIIATYLLKNKGEWLIFEIK